MSGPPGLGKTTLANIIAGQAGYNILEINARCVALFPAVPATRASG